MMGSRSPGVQESWVLKSWGPGVRAGVVAVVLAGVLLSARPVAQRSPARIVSLIPAVTEMLFAMGAGPKVVGVSTFDTYPAEAATRTRVGGLIDPNFEAILALRPDLVVAYGSQEELIARLAQVGIPTHVYRHGSLPDITATIRALGQRTGHSEAADALASTIDRDLDAIRAEVKGLPNPRTLLVFGREEGAMRGLFVSGGVGFLHDMLVVAGGTNVMADIPREGLQLSYEQLLARGPDVVLEVRASERWPPDRLARESAAWQSVSIPAVRASRVHFLTDPALTVPGPRVASAIRLIADALRR